MENSCDILYYSLNDDRIELTSDAWFEYDILPWADMFWKQKPLGCHNDWLSFAIDETIAFN